MKMSLRRAIEIWTKQTIYSMFLFLQVHLVDQHHNNEFSKALSDYRLVAISGDSEEKNFFGRVVRESDLVICTAQILQNALINSEEDKHVELTG